MLFNARRLLQTFNSSNFLTIDSFGIQNLHFVTEKPSFCEFLLQEKHDRELPRHPLKCFCWHFSCRRGIFVLGRSWIVWFRDVERNPLQLRRITFLSQEMVLSYILCNQLSKILVLLFASRHFLFLPHIDYKYLVALFYLSLVEKLINTISIY